MRRRAAADSTPSGRRQLRLADSFRSTHAQVEATRRAGTNRRRHRRDRRFRGPRPPRERPRGHHGRGIHHPTPIQREAIPLALNGRDLIGLAQTGTGKTAAFTLPIVDRLIDGPRRTRALILTPTRELCVQVEESFRKYAQARADRRSSRCTAACRSSRRRRRCARGVDVVVATPGRLIDHLERQNVVFDDLEVLVLDEADRMLDMGFAPQINRIVERDPEVPADAAVQRDDAARGRGAGAQVPAQAGRGAGRACARRPRAR